MASACHRCGLPLPGARIPAGYACGRCRRQPPAYDQLVALWIYQPPLDVVVRELKYGGLAFLASHLGEAMADLGGQVLSTVDQVVPVPLHWRRLLSRGYNQAEEIAYALSRRIGRPAHRSLRRHRPTDAQASLPRSERRLNLDRAFRLRRASDVAGRTVALIDDVVTTGTTLESCTRVLKQAGAAQVIAVVAGRTLRHAGRVLEGYENSQEPSVDRGTGRATPVYRGGLD